MIFHFLKRELVCEIVPSSMSNSINTLGQYTIEQIQAQPNGTPSKIKVKVRLNRNGIFDISQAAIIDTTTIVTEEPVGK